MASFNDSPDDEEPTENLQSMFSDKKYEECYRLYKDADEAFNSSGLDTLERLTLQYHVMKDSPISIAEVLHRRMEGLKEGQRELRVYIAGEIAVGKTTFLNLLMGGNYLPTGHGSCTNVLCEVYNNPVRLGVITYETKPPTCTEICLNPNCTSEEWRRLQNCIREKKDNKQNVSKVQIYWPLEIFKSFQQTEPKEVTRQSSGSLDMGSDTEGMVRGDLPIVFMDFPGIDPDHEELFRPYLQHLDKCHTFIFLIDVHRDHGVHGPTLLKLMSDMTNATTQESSTLDPESALFICTGCPKTLLEDQERMKLLTEKVLKRIQLCWPMVEKNQIAFMKDQDQIKKDLTDLLQLQNDLVNFLVKSERLLLEEHCMWLTKLLECTSVYFKFGNKWKSLEDISRVDKSMRESIENLISFHEHLTSNSNTIKQIRDIQKNYEDKIRRYLDVEINSDELTLPDIISLRDQVGDGLMSFQEACDREIEMVLEEQRKKFQNTFVHCQIQTPENRNESYLLFMNILSISLMAVFLWPIGVSMAALAIFEFVSSIREGDIITKPILIKKIITKIKESVDSKLNKCLHEIERQRKDLVDILNQNQRNQMKKISKDRVDQSQKFDDIAKRLWDVYVGYVMKHEFSSNEIDVHYEKSVSGHYGTCRFVYEAYRQTQKLIVKEIQTKLINKDSADMGIEKMDAIASLPYDSSIYRERYL